MSLGIELAPTILVENKVYPFPHPQSIPDYNTMMEYTRNYILIKLFT